MQISDVFLLDVRIKYMSLPEKKRIMAMKKLIRKSKRLVDSKTSKHYSTRAIARALSKIFLCSAENVRYHAAKLTNESV